MATNPAKYPLYTFAPLIDDLKYMEWSNFSKTAYWLQEHIYDVYEASKDLYVCNAAMTFRNVRNLQNPNAKQEAQDACAEFPSFVKTIKRSYKRYKEMYASMDKTGQKEFDSWLYDDVSRSRKYHRFIEDKKEVMHYYRGQRWHQHSGSIIVLRPIGCAFF